MNNADKKYIISTEQDEKTTTLDRSRKKYQVANNNSLDNNQQLVTVPYFPLPEEYSIFSEIDDKYFSLDDTEQHRFVSKCLCYLKSKLHMIYMSAGVVKVLPKLSLSTDEDAAIIINWAYTSFRIYFNFEVQVENSYYGVVVQSTEESVSTNTGKLTNTNCHAVLDAVLSYVINNS